MRRPSRGLRRGASRLPGATRTDPLRLQLRVTGRGDLELPGVLKRGEERRAIPVAACSSSLVRAGSRAACRVGAAGGSREPLDFGVIAANAGSSGGNWLQLVRLTHNGG